MDTDAVLEASVSIDHVDSYDQMENSGKSECSNGVSGHGEAINLVEVLTRIELDLACVSEKIINLFVLMMNVATMENEFEAFASERERASNDDPLEKALEFDFLSGVLDSEVRDLDGFISVLRSEIDDARLLVSSIDLHEEGTFKGIEEKLHDSEKSFKQAQDQISEIRTQSATFQRTILNREENQNSDKSLGEDQSFNVEANIKMQTAGQQRHMLRMFEKSLAREMDLEKKLTELRQVEEELKQRLIASERGMYCLDDETSDVSGRRLDVLVAQTNSLKESLREADDKLILANSEAFALSEKVSFLEKQLKESKSQLPNAEFSESIVSDSKEKKNEAESNMGPDEELNFLKSGLGDSDKVESLEKQLTESNIQLQRAIASVDANQEKQNLLNLTIKDMQQTIDDLKMKVVKHERQTNIAEEKCIVLSESNAELNDELNFLRERLEALEASLQQADETKLAAAKGIGLQNKVVKNLVLQLACERNRLHKQISLLATENKRLVQKLQGNNNDKSEVTNNGNTANGEKYAPPNHGLATNVIETSTASSKMVKSQEHASISENEIKAMPGPETVRRIDAGVLSFKYVFSAGLILLFSVAAYYGFQLESCPF